MDFDEHEGQVRVLEHEKSYPNVLMMLEIDVHKCKLLRFNKKFEGLNKDLEKSVYVYVSFKNLSR